MSIKMPSQGVVMFAGAVLAITAAASAVKKISDMKASTVAKNVTQGVAGAVAGAALGVVAGTSDAFNDPQVNPLHSAGSALGGTIYDWLH